MQKSKPILPGQTIGIIGGGQLGRMMAIAAKYMGYDVIVLDPTPNCPTAQVADKQMIAHYDDFQAIEQLTEQSDVVTYEFENVDLTAAKQIENNMKLPQGTQVLAVTQNRDQEKHVLTELGLPVASFVVVDEEEECEVALKDVGFPAVIKTCHGGYDGKGQLKIDGMEDIPAAKAFVRKHKQRCMIEQWLTFDREISIIFTRTSCGEIEFFPVAENKHRHHILDETIAPAHISERVTEQAILAAKKVAEHLHIVGTFAIEMFVSGDEIYINEMAPRPHNSGHYTIEACNISQFAQHIRAVCGLPLMKVTLREPAVMINILGEHVEPLLRVMPQMDSGFVHLYGKADIKEKRKMGHVTFTAPTEEKRDHVAARFKEDMQ